MPPSTTLRPRALLASALAGLLLATAACGSDGTSAVSSATSAPGTAAPTAASSSSSSAASAPSSAVSSAVSSASSTSGSVSSSGTPSAGVGLDAKGCIRDYDAATDYFPTKLTIEHSTTLAISYHRSYQVLTVTPPGGTAETYLLVRCGAPQPALTGTLAGAQVVTTPVSSLYSASTTHLPSLVALDRLSVVTGVSSAAFVSEPQVLQYFSRSKPVEFAPSGTVDAEAVISGKPQVLIGGGFADPSDGKIEAAGIPVLQDLDAQEATPLGQAEWIKFFGALTGTEAAAEKTYAGIEAEYTRLAALTKNAEKVQVVPGQPYQGEWYVPAGGSNKGRLLADAGATTAWADDTSTGSVKTTFEKVFATSSTAPVWIASTTWTTRAEALKEDPRFARFAAFRDGDVWNPVKGVTAAGGNPYYELGGLRVDLALADLIAIVHPDLLPDHDFTFYVKLG